MERLGSVGSPSIRKVALVEGVASLCQSGIIGTAVAEHLGSVRQFGIDATCIPESLVCGRGVIWFQCPWLPGGCGIGELMSFFLLNLAGQIEAGVYACIGITSYFPYIKDYQLESIIGEGLKAIDNHMPVLEKYKFIGVDKELIKDILSFGYHHQTVHEDKDIHYDIFAHHLTLIFQRKSKLF